MPDNRTGGMLETFLAYMIRDQSQPLWKYTKEVVSQVSQSKEFQAPFKEAHIDKANIYTWLAWQKQPGRQLHQAIKEHILDPRYPHPKAEAFFHWFKSLYEL